MAGHDFLYKKLFIIIFDLNLFLDSRLIYLISAREEHRRYDIWLLKLYKYWLFTKY